MTIVGREPRDLDIHCVDPRAVEAGPEGPSLNVGAIAKPSENTAMRGSAEMGSASCEAEVEQFSTTMETPAGPLKRGKWLIAANRFADHCQRVL
jgi:hypothetical protein